jgi:hypothetical protein
MTLPTTRIRPWWTTANGFFPEGADLADDAERVARTLIRHGAVV